MGGRFLQRLHCGRSGSKLSEERRFGSGGIVATIQTAGEVLDLAAALDRIERSDAFIKAKSDQRLGQIQEALKILASDGSDRAERIQLLFSDEYRAGWNR
jgi:hypothetical protein